MVVSKAVVVVSVVVSVVVVAVVSVGDGLSATPKSVSSRSKSSSDVSIYTSTQGVSSSKPHSKTTATAYSVKEVSGVAELGGFRLGHDVVFGVVAVAVAGCGIGMEKRCTVMIHQQHGDDTSAAR